MISLFVPAQSYTIGVSQEDGEVTITQEQMGGDQTVYFGYDQIPQLILHLQAIQDTYKPHRSPFLDPSHRQISKGEDQAEA